MKAKAIILFYVTSLVMMISACHQQSTCQTYSNNGEANAVMATENAKMAKKAEYRQDVVTEEAEAMYDELVEKNDEPTKKIKTTWKKSDKSENEIAIFIGDNEKLDIEGTNVNIQVDGFRARVLTNIYVYNNREGNLEGNFKMKLPAGASPYYFAFGETEIKAKMYENKDGKNSTQPNQISLTDENISELNKQTWTNVKEAKIVPKEKAAHAYQETVSKQVDPALVEWGGADVFNCRIFPLVSNKLHRVVIGYDVNLMSVGNDFLLDFQLPKANQIKLLSIEANKLGNITPTVTGQGIMNQQVQVHLKNPEANAIKVRYTNGINSVLFSKVESEGYFACKISPNIPINIASKTSSDAVLMIDVSLSSQPDKFNVWLKLAEQILANNEASIKRFAVNYFNIDNHWWKQKWVANTSTNRNAFVNYTNETVLVGATNLKHALKESSQPEWETAHQNKLVFLLSDGASTWGDQNNYAISSAVHEGDKVFAFTTGMSGTAVNILEQLCRETNGAVYSVNGEDDIVEASTSFNHLPWTIKSISLDGSKEIIISGRPKQLYPNQKLLITGKSEREVGELVKLKLEQNGIEKTVNVKLKNRKSSELVNRVYGHVATTQLEEFGHDLEESAKSYALHFKVPGKTCSLLMLESATDYESYNIKPEETQYYVNASNVKKLVHQIIEEKGSSLSNPKQHFSNWVSKLEKLETVDFTASATFKMLVQNTRRDKFMISEQALKSTIFTRNALGIVKGKHLKESTLDYDNIVYEAKSLHIEGKKADAVKYISSLVERNANDGVMLRDIAYTCMEWGYADQAYYLMKKVIDSRPHEPQSYHLMAQLLAKMNKIELATLYYEIAISTNWDNKYGDYNKIVSFDYLNFLKKIKTENSDIKSYTDNRIESVLEMHDISSADLVVIISWNTNNTDIDLHVKEPTGEECYYSHPKTKIGGNLTKDVTQGYGPEMYVLKEAKAGQYNIKAKYFSSNRNRASARTKVYAKVIKNWGESNETMSEKVVELKTNKSMHQLFELSI